MSLGKRGPLPTAGGPPAKFNYKCIVPDCQKLIRGDKLKEHYVTWVDFDLLKTVKTIDKSNAFAQISKEKNVEKQNHTKFFYEKEKFSITDIPGYKSHTKRSEPKLNPFERCKSSNINLSSETGDIDTSILDEEVGNEPQPGTFRDCQEEDGGVPLVPHDNILEQDHSLNEVPANAQPEPLIQEDTVFDFHDPIVDTDVREESIATGSLLFEETEPGRATDTEESIKEQVLSVLKDVVQSEDINVITDMIADKIADRLNKKKDESKEQDGKTTSWKTVGNHEMCDDCFRYKDSEDVPQKLRHLRKGTFGLLSVTQEQFNRKHLKQQHESSELHTWCYFKSQQVKQNETNADNISEQAGMKIVRNAVLCFKEGWSSEDFQALNDKDNLTEEISNKTATKNDSRAEFFSLRDTIFDKTKEKVHQLFKKTKWFTVTCDKVTAYRNSYTVIMCYLFYGGRIYVILNGLVKMSSDDYDSSGTAKMILKCLQESTGLNMTEIGRKLVHSPHDAVYANKDKRIRGGGSLSLTEELSRQLGLEKTAITSDVDGGHAMQSTMGDCMRDNPIIMKTINILFDAMKHFHLGKAGTIFHERAQEMEHLVLTNKKNQTTRFVRATLRGATTGLRNLPTIYKILAEEYEDCIEARSNTRAKELNDALKPLRDSENVTLWIGLVQLLEVYSSCSLATQHSFWFPTQVWKAVNDAKEVIKKLSEEWVWETKELYLAGIGSPTKHIENLKKGIFKPFVPITSVRRSSLKDRLEIGRSSSLFDEEEQMVADFAGEINLIGDFDKIEPKVKKTLEDICSDLIKRWDERQTETPLQLATISAFASPIDFEENSEEGITQMREKLERVVMNLSQYQKQQFDSLQATAGYIDWNQFYARHGTIQINEAWPKWLKQLTNAQKADYTMFIDLFENVQIRSMSEAMCETVGSLMACHGAKGRYLQPKFFSQEIYLRFNLGPLHLLSDFCLEIVKERNKEYVRKGDLKKTFHKLVSEQSAALKTYRSQEEVKAKLPLDVWK